MVWAIPMGARIFSLILHQLYPNCVERARHFITGHGGRWISLPPSTGAKYFIVFPSGTRIFPVRDYDQYSEEQRSTIILPDGTSLQALSRRISGQTRSSNTLILPPDGPAFFPLQPVLPVTFTLPTPKIAN
jgi:hypothetical protein